MPVAIGDVSVRPGDLLLGDEDGLLVGPAEGFAAAIDGAEAIQGLERRMRAAIEGGTPLLDDLLTFAEHAAALAAGRESRLAFREPPAAGGS